MNKTLRILAKDARHLRIEIFLSLALTLGFALTDHFAWPGFAPGLREGGTLRMWMTILLPVAWWLLIARAVHDESLVGDRQFWITRPYGWPRVLAAKIIFIALFILIPFFLAQCFILHQAGLHPLSVLPSLAVALLILSGFVLIPLMAVSAVTANVTRMFVTFFGIILYAALIAYTCALITAHHAITRVPRSIGHYLWMLLFIPVVSIIVTFLQYARRRTTLSVALLLGLCVVVTGMCVLELYAPQSDVRALAPGEGSPVKIAFDPDPMLQHPIDPDPGIQAGFDAHNQLPPQIPVIFSGIASGHAIVIEAEKLTVSSSDGSTVKPWNGRFSDRFTVEPWNGRSASPVVNGQRETVAIPLPLYRDFAGKTVNIHVTYAVTELEAESPLEVSVRGPSIEVPQHGRCSQDKDGDPLYCLYAFTQPDITHVTWKQQLDCAGPSAGVPEDQWIGDSDHGVIDYYDFTPVTWLPTPLITRNYDFLPSSEGRLCPGSPLTFTKYHVVRRRMIEVNLPPLDPRLYVRTPRVRLNPGPLTPTR